MSAQPDNSYHTMATADDSQHAAWVDFEFLVSLLICSSVTEVTQQTKARHKDDFVMAFSPVIAEATAAAYKGAQSDVQSKLRKVVTVWRDRTIFEPPIQAAIEGRIEGMSYVDASTIHPAPVHGRH